MARYFLRVTLKLGTLIVRSRTGSSTCIPRARSPVLGRIGNWCTELKLQINIDQAIHDSLLQPGLLRDKMQDGKERKLHNLLTSQPALSLDGEGVVYLLTKAKFMQRQAWVLAVDVKGNKILGLAEFGTDTYLGLSLAYCPSRISSYMDAWTVQTISYILVLYKFLVL